MKKFLLIAVAAMGLLFTACSKDEVAQPIGGEESVVTFTVEAPVMATRYGEGTTATQLYWAVYDKSHTLLFQSNEATVMSGLKATVEIPFVNGMAYNILFWAESANSPYSVNWAEKSVVYKNASQLANDENYDAFFCYFTELDEITGPVNEDVELKRPFAQLRIATNDTAAAALSGISVTDTKVTVANTYTAFDFVAGDVDVNVNTSTVEFAYNDAAKKAVGQIEVGGTTYDLLTVNYLFGFKGDKKLVDATLTYKYGDTEVSAEYNSVPIQQNYRTNIIGSLLTSEGKFNIDIEEGFADEEHNVEVVTVATATELVDEITNGDADQIILTGDIDLSDLLGRAADNESLIIPAERTVTLNLGGFTLSHAKTQTGAFNMIQNMGTLTIENGTVSYADNGNGGNYVSNTIQNSGVLTLKDVTVENNSSNGVAANGYPHPVDNSGKLIVEEGTVLTNSTNYSSMRIWCTEDTDTEVTINGGTFNGSIDFQTVSVKPNKGTLTINGGTFNADTYTKSAVRLLGFGTDVDEMVATINGGTFNGLIKRGKYVDGEFNSQVFFVKGGTFNDASVFEFLADGAKIELGADIEASDIIFIGNSVKINGNGHSISTTANRVMRITAPDINVELNNVNIVSNAVRVGSNDIRGISVDNTASGLNLTLNNCNIDFTDASAHDWAYAVNQVATTNNTISINGGTYEGANVINIWGSYNTINIDGATLNCLYKPNTQYHGSCITFNSGASDNIVTVKNTTFNSPGGNAKVKWDEGSNNTVYQENNTDNTTVAKFITTTEALAEAVAVGGNVFLGADITVDETVIIPEGKTVVLDLNGKTLSAADKNTIKNNGGILTIKNGTVTRTGDVVGYAVNNASGEIYVENATVKVGLYTSGSKFVATNANISHEQSSRHAIYAYNCEVTLNGGTYHNGNAGNATLMAAGTSEVDIISGTFSIADGRPVFGWTSCLLDVNNQAKINITDGVFNGGFRVQSGTTMTINGGSFNDCYGSNYNIYGTAIVKGGTYTDAAAQAFAKKYVAEGYEFVTGSVVAK